MGLRAPAGGSPSSVPRGAAVNGSRVDDGEVVTAAGGDGKQQEMEQRPLQVANVKWRRSGGSGREERCKRVRQKRLERDRTCWLAAGRTVDAGCELVLERAVRFRMQWPRVSTGGSVAQGRRATGRRATGSWMHALVELWAMHRALDSAVAACQPRLCAVL